MPAAQPQSLIFGEHTLLFTLRQLQTAEAAKRPLCNLWTEHVKQAQKCRV